MQLTCSPRKLTTSTYGYPQAFPTLPKFTTTTTLRPSPASALHILAGFRTVFDFLDQIFHVQIGPIIFDSGDSLVGPLVGPRAPRVTLLDELFNPLILTLRIRLDHSSDYVLLCGV